jgi:hypothetical protein
MEYHGQREPLKRRDVSLTGWWSLVRVFPGLLWWPNNLAYAGASSEDRWSTMAPRSPLSPGVRMDLNQRAGIGVYDRTSIIVQVAGAG